MKSLYDCFMDRDCDLVEINPMITTKDGKVMCADSKVTIDSNAAYRQKDLRDMEDKTQLNAKAKMLSKTDLEATWVIIS